MPACPFYGFRWPERSSNLRQTDGNECGLDFDQCDLPDGDRRPRSRLLSMSSRRVCRIGLEAGKNVITFHAGGRPPVTLAEWENRYSRRIGGDLPGRLPDSR
jgi:hypothetical protein